MDEPAAPPPRSSLPALLASPAVRTGADAAAFAMLAVAAVGLAVFGGRREIARELAEDWLRERGIESGFVIEAVDSGAFVGRVRLGPDRDPIFAADRVEVAYDLTPPWSGAPFSLSTRAVRLVRPRLRIAYDGRRFSAGPLDALIKDFLARPKTAEPGPAVLVEDARITLTTPNGLVRVTGDAAIDDNRLLRFDGRLLPARLKGQDFVAATEGGTVSLRKVGETLTASVRLASSDLTAAGFDFDDADAAIEGALPYPDMEAQTLEGPVNLGAAIRADKVGTGAMAASAFEGNFRVRGRVSGPFAQPALSGSLSGVARSGALTAGGLDARDVRGHFDIARLSLAGNAAGVKFTGEGTIGLHAARAASGAMFMEGADLSLRAPRLVFTSGEGAASLASSFSGDLRAARMTAGDLTLADAAASGSGGFSARDGKFTLLAEADARAAGSLPAGRAREIAAELPLISEDPPQRAAIGAALQRFDIRAPKVRLAVGDGTRVSLAAPATFASPSGGRAVLSPRGGPLLVAGGAAHGAFDLAVSGAGLPKIDAQVASWSMRGGALDAELAVSAALDAPPAQDADIEAAGRLRMAGGRTTFDLARCGRFASPLVDFGDVDVTALSARICPSGGPLVSAGGGAWRVAGRFEQTSASFPTLTAAAGDASGTFDVGGRDDMDRAAIRLAAASLSDTQAEKRFRPIRASGRVDLAGGVWRGAFPLSTGSGRAFALAGIHHDVAAERGGLDIDATKLAFHPDGLQPSELAPVADFLRNADGEAAFTGRFAWGPDGPTSSGALAIPRLNFASPAGTVTGLSTQVAFTSLAPLVTAPDQRLTIQRINAITPLEALTATYDMGAEAITIDALTTNAAKGRLSLEPTVLPLAGDQTMRGVLVLDNVSLGELVTSSTLAEKVHIDAVVDGRLPFAYGPEGLRFTQGRIVAVQPGRISIDRAALSNVKTEGGAEANPMDAAPAAPQEVNAIQDFAYQAMENLSFETLEAKVNSAPGGRLSMLFGIKGKHDPEVAEQARVGVRELLSGTAFKRRIPLPEGTPIDLTLDTSLNFDELLQAWQRQWADAPE